MTLALVILSGVIYTLTREFVLVIAVLAAMGAAIRINVLRGRGPLPLARVGLEVGIVSAGFLLYELGRKVFQASPADAVHNADMVVGFEKAMGIFVEPKLQALVSGHPAIDRALMLVYSHGYPAIPLAGLVFLLLTDRRGYLALRNALALSALLGVVTLALFPVAPPRLTQGIGVTDVFAARGAPMTFANQFAAIPSFHVGWVMTAAFVVSRTTNLRAVRLLWPLPGLVMLLVVVVTGNHYWVDAAVGIAYSLVPAWWFLRRADRVPERARPPLPAPGRRALTARD
ncbi:MAG: phosphatase PAP2 family protein [Chloroflexi bacterium]|nr:phosphatase PAP2 family protein [Chloroflexota bacterium]